MAKTKSRAAYQREYRRKNLDKVKAYQKKWRDNNLQFNRDRQRKYWLKNQYGLTEEDYERILRDQDYRCKICGVDKPTGKWKVFAVDHCHETGEVRGLLCNECNRGMGLLKDDPDRLRKAAKYIEDHKRKTKDDRYK